MNKGSSQRKAIDKFFDPGLRFLPFEFVMHLGFPRESKNNRFLVAAATSSSGGGPNTSMRHASCSTSFSPGNNG
jgi:hypothetical protein